MAERHTRSTQNRLPERACGFESHPGYPPPDECRHPRARPSPRSTSSPRRLRSRSSPAPGSDAERRAARHLAERLEPLGREMPRSSRSPSGRPGLRATRHQRDRRGRRQRGRVSSAKLGAALVLLATVLTFLDLAGISPTTRRLLGRRASQNVVSWGEREQPGALLLVAHLDSGPTRPRPRCGRCSVRPARAARLLRAARGRDERHRAHRSSSSSPRSR